MAITTMHGTERDGRVALGVELKRTRPGRASISDVAVAPNVVTALITDVDDDVPSPEFPSRASDGFGRWWSSRTSAGR
jgi:hypothetical protein